MEHLIRNGQKEIEQQLTKLSKIPVEGLAQLHGKSEPDS
jgi:hypothetical protein